MASLDFILAEGVAGTGLLDADTTIGVTGWGALIAKVIRPLVMGRSYTGSR